MSIALTNRTTVIDRFVNKSLAADVVLVLAGTALTSVAAQLAIPNQPVPFTFQTLAVLLTASVLGAVRGALSLGLYALVGAIGLPVFTSGGSGMNYLFGATGGYIVGFVLAAFIVGLLAEKGWSKSSLGMIGSYVIGSAIIYTLGATWLTYGYMKGDLSAGLNAGVYPFLAWDAIKAFVAAAIVPEAWRIAQKLKK